MTSTKTLAAARGLALVLLCAAFLCPPAGNDAQAKQKNRKNQLTTGRIEVSTNPGGHPITIDGQPAGETTDYVRAVELPPGPHTVEILFPNNTRWSHTFNIVAGRKECIALNYRPRSIPLPPAVISPCPYPVNVSSPASVTEGDNVTFTADVGYTGQSALNYTWTVSPPAARIMNGAGTPTISVDTSGLGNKRVTAILVVDDGSGDRNCRQTAQAATGVGVVSLPNPPRRFDEFPSVAFDDDKARLDTFAIELQNSPGSVGYIIAYEGVRSRAGLADAMGTRARTYLVQTRGMDSSRIVTINGGLRQNNEYELWLVPQGAAPPTPRPTATPDERRPAPPRAPRRTRRD